MTILLALLLGFYLGGMFVTSFAMEPAYFDIDGKVIEDEKPAWYVNLMGYAAWPFVLMLAIGNDNDD